MIASITPVAIQFCISYFYFATPNDLSTYLPTFTLTAPTAAEVKVRKVVNDDFEDDGIQPIDSRWPPLPSLLLSLSLSLSLSLQPFSGVLPCCSHDGNVQFLVWHREPPSKTVILKYDLLLVFQKRSFRFDTNNKCQYDKTMSYWRWLDFGIKKIDTCSQGYDCQTKSFSKK